MKMIKNNHSKALWGVFLLLVILLVVQINIVSAMKWDNIKEFKDDGKYGTIEIYNSFIIPGIIKGDLLSEYTLVENTDQCIVNCYAEGTATLYESATLFDDYDFEDKNEKKKLLNYNIYIEKENREDIIVIDYEEQCNEIIDNSTTYEVCERIEVGQHEEEVITYDWKKYNGEILITGDYKWRLEEKGNGINTGVDWAVGMAGISTDEVRAYWAWWDSSWIYQRSLNITNFDTYDYLNKTTVNMSLDTSTLVSGGKLQADCDDLRVIYNDNLDMNRLIENCDDAGTRIIFSLKDTITSGSSDLINYKIYYGSALATNPPDNELGDNIFIWKDNMTSDLGGWKNDGGIFGTSGLTVSNQHVTRDIGWNNNLQLYYETTNTGGDNWGCGSLRVNTYGSPYPGTGTCKAARSGWAVDDALIDIGSGIGFNTYYNANINVTNNDFLMSLSNGNLRSGTSSVAGNNISFWTDTATTHVFRNVIAQSFFDSPPTVIVGIETFEDINIIQSSPIDKFNTTDTTPDLSCNFTSSDTINITNVSINVFDSSDNLDYTNTDTTPAGLTKSVNKTWTTSTLTDDTYKWGCVGRGDNNEIGQTGNRTITIDSTPPLINVTTPRGNQGFFVLNNNLSLNWSIAETNPNTCWFDYNSINITVNCDANNYSFTPVDNVQTLIFYANDTLNNLNSNATNWDYKLLFINQSFAENTTSGSLNTFISNFKTNGTRISTINLNYNNTNNLASLSSSGNNYTASITQLSPGVQILTNISFFWNINMEDSSSFLTSSSNQSVSPININDTCASGSNVIYNLTIVDEITQQKIDGEGFNGSITVDFNLYTSDRRTLLKKFFTQKTNINNLAICIDNNLNGGEQFSMDLQIQYDATNYSSEFYNLEREILNKFTLSQNITLYDLEDSAAQEFKLNVRDKSFVPIIGALIEIQRKYIENGTFNIIEIPKTDSLGIATASLQVNNVIYNFDIYLNGILISSFTNVFAVCQNPSLRECEIDFNAFLDGVTIPDYSTADDFNFTLGYNSTSRIITSQFLIPSGNPSTIKLEVIKEDALGTSICSDILTSTSGILSCVVPSNFGNATIRARLLRNNVVQGFGSFKLDQTPSDIFGVILIFISVLVMMTLIGVGVSDNPIITAVFLFIGVILLFSMNLVQNTGFYGATASILFFAIAIILVIIKAARRN